MLKSAFHIDKNIDLWLRKATVFANQHSHFCFLQSNNIPYPNDAFPTLIAIGARELFTDTLNSFEELKAFHKNEWLFGYFGYDLKNQVEDLKSNHSNHTRFPDICFFKPEILIQVNGLEISIEAPNPSEVFQQIQNSQINDPVAADFSLIRESIGREDYIETVQKLRQHIEDGDIYEINFCQEFFGEIVSADPVDVYWSLNQVSPKPFSAFQKFEDQYLLCASPERFIKKKGQKLISQPIKGTIKRGLTPEHDQELKFQLRNDEKELAENMMIVDLVRNDLAKSSKPGSVKVEEMFGIYSFEQVHQMISTIIAKSKEDIHFVDIIKNAFPMGSMTGAPKVKVMELIEHYEKSKRGIFSGAAGYITSKGDFDFNVIIRSLFLNMHDNQFSFQVGSAITYDSDPVKEYEECLLKASAIKAVLEQVIMV